MRNLTKVLTNKQSYFEINSSPTNKNEKAMDKNLIIENLEKRVREKIILAFHSQSHDKLPVNSS